MTQGDVHKEEMCLGTCWVALPPCCNGLVAFQQRSCWWGSCLLLWLILGCRDGKFQGGLSPRQHSVSRMRHQGALEGSEQGRGWESSQHPQQGTRPLGNGGEDAGGISLRPGWRVGRVRLIPVCRTEMGSRGRWLGAPCPQPTRTQREEPGLLRQSCDLSQLLICNRLRVHAVVSVYEHSAALSSANSIHQLLDRLGE